MKRSATAVWNGDLKNGKGRISTDSGVLSDTPYSFSARFENGKGTNPEELVAAAHAGCFAMALSMILGEIGVTAESIEAKGTVSLEKQGEGFAVTASHLDVHLKTPGADKAKVEEAAQKAKAGCPISKLLKAEITMNTTIEV